MSETASGGSSSNGGSTFVFSTGGSASVTNSVDASLGGAASHDPTLFAWPESNADGGSDLLCKPGHYVGTYTCTIRPPAQYIALFGDAAVTYKINGPVDLTLDKGQDGEFLTVSGGTLKSTAGGFLALDATVVGKLDCQTGTFTGTLENGTVSIPPFPSGGSFSGPLAASFSPSGPALNGNWTLIGGTTFQGTSCTGPWNATYQGP
jgi:hypothetical protein